MAARVLARLVYGLLSVTPRPQSAAALARPAIADAGSIAGSGAWPRGKATFGSASNARPGSGSGAIVPSVSMRAGPNATSTLAWATWSVTSCRSPPLTRRAWTSGLSVALPVSGCTHTIAFWSPKVSPIARARISAVASARSWSRVSSCWRKKSSRRRTSTGATSVRVRATTAMNANVRRVWNDWGTGLRRRPSAP